MLGGLLSHLDVQQQLKFDPQDLSDLRTKLSAIMPEFRAAIEQNNTEEFNQKLKDLVLKGLAAFGGRVLISGLIGLVMDEQDLDHK